MKIRETNKKTEDNMKRYGFLYEKVYDIDNIKQAIYNASKGKRNRRRVSYILENSDEYAERIHLMLKHKIYSPSQYIEQTIYDGCNKKERIIHKPKFYPDQIIHWALMQVIQPYLQRGFYEHSCGSIPGKGTSYGHKYLKKWLRDEKNTKYCLKIDISKFYPSIDKNILKSKFRTKFKDEDLLWLLDSIVNSSQNGLPIGNYTSQWFANFYLQDLDHFIKNELKIKYYMRYIDDMVLLGPNKRKLHNSKTEIERYLSDNHLRLKPNWQVFRIDDRGLDFLGFRFYRHKVILRKRNALRIRRRIKKIAKRKPLISDAQAVISYWGWLKRSNSFYFYNKYIKDNFPIKKARVMISEDAKQHTTKRCIRN